VSSATKRLHVENNRLRSLPELPEDLRELHAQHNQLTQLPERFPRNLLRLRLDSNQLSAVPTGLDQLPELALLWLADNPELPEAWQKNVPAEADQLDRVAVVAFLAERKKEAEEQGDEDDDTSGSLSDGDEMEKRNAALDDHTQTMGLLGLMLSPEHRDSLTPKVTRK
jgi:Leucine-rich repeat (LRR) protein